MSLLWVVVFLYLSMWNDTLGKAKPICFIFNNYLCTKHKPSSCSCKENYHSNQFLYSFCIREVHNCALNMSLHPMEEQYKDVIVRHLPNWKSWVKDNSKESISKYIVGTKDEMKGLSLEEVVCIKVLKISLYRLVQTLHTSPRSVKYRYVYCLKVWYQCYLMSVYLVCTDLRPN